MPRCSNSTSASPSGAIPALDAADSLPVVASGVVRNSFFKGHGLGNDYIVVDPEELDFKLTPRRIQALCDRHEGIGGDGILALFGALETNPWQGSDAVRAALATQAALERYNDELEREGHDVEPALGVPLVQVDEVRRLVVAVRTP